MASFKSIINRYRRIIRWGFYIIVLCVVIDTGYILSIIPDWKRFEHGRIQKSAFITDYESQRRVDNRLPPLRWQPVALNDISRNILRAVIIAEDARFYEHGGIDTEALKEAWDYNLEKGRVVYGGSTISQQMIKNVLLSPSRDPLRKWHELWLTLSLENNVSKDRILEVYLNIAEFGIGIYGVEAASQHYWGYSAQYLSMEHAIELAATLTSPKKNNPDTRTDYFLRQVNKINRNMRL